MSHQARAIVQLGLLVLLSRGEALAGDVHVPRILEQKGEYRRYSFAATIHGAPARTTLEVWEGSREFLGEIETVNEKGEVGSVRLEVAGTFRREGKMVVFSTGYADTEVRAEELPDGTLLPRSSNVPFVVEDTEVRVVERRAPSKPPKKNPKPPKT